MPHLPVLASGSFFRPTLMSDSHGSFARGKREGRTPLHRVKVRGGFIAYTERGSGRPLVCLHGGMGIDGGSLRVPGIHDLADHGIHVVIPDQRGHGRSSRLPAPLLYSHARWASDARDFARRLGFEQFALLGHSYGGFIALECASRWPEAVTHLVLVATSAGPVVAATTRVRSAGELRTYFERVWPRFFADGDPRWPLFRTLLFSAAPYNAAFARELPRYDVRAQAARLQMPTLLIVGSGDPYRGPMEWLAEHLPRVRLVVFDRTGHLPYVERPGAFTNEVAAFFDANPAGPTRGLTESKRAAP